MSSFHLGVTAVSVLLVLSDVLVVLLVLVSWMRPVGGEKRVPVLLLLLLF